MNLIQIQEDQLLIESERTIESLEAHEPPVLIETSAGQGIQGPRGEMGPKGEVEISNEINNRLVMKPDGLYVRDRLDPDPVAYYLLSRG